MAFPEGDTFLTSSKTQGPLGTGTKPTKKAPEKSSTGGLLLLIFAPWSMFTLVMLVFTFCFFHYAVIVWFVVLMCAMMSGIMMILSPRNRKGPLYTYLGVTCLFAIFVGSMLGLYNHYQFMFSYWTYNEARVYTDVLPSEPAAAHADAGTMVFSMDARVDTTKALGYKARSVYCVAPILDDTQMTRVEYWAAGYDCCSQRADFNCDDAWDPKARSGVVVIDNNSILPSGHDWFMKAVAQAKAAYGVDTPEKPIFVRWVTDPLKVENEFYLYGMGFLIGASGVFFIVCLIIGGLLHMARTTPGR